MSHKNKAQTHTRVANSHVEICKEFRFEASHILQFHNGKCANLHGHSYRVVVCYAGPINETYGEYDFGMVIDFSELSDVWHSIKYDFDHVHLNDAIRKYPTAENIAYCLGEKFEEYIKHPTAYLTKVRVYETATSYAEVTYSAQEERKASLWERIWKKNSNNS